MSKRIVLEDHKLKYADRGLDIEAAGQLFHVDAPQLWPDDIMALATANDMIGIATAVLGGPDRYQAWCAAGGTAGLLSGIIEEEFGATIPELGASSSS